MTDFAKKPVAFDDKQSSVLKCPEEIYARGFFPPIQLPDGRVIKGDVLPSGWFNDLMSRAMQSNINELPVAAVPSSFGWNEAASGVTDWFAIHVGPISIEIGSIRETTNSSPTLVPKTPFIGNPQVYLTDISDPTVANGKMVGWTGVGGTLPQKPLAFCSLNRAEGFVAPGTFYYILVGERAVTGQTPGGKPFCSEPQTFLDGQTSFSAPTNDQVSFGFVPPVMDTTGLREADTLPANVLNYLFHELTANIGSVYWEMKNDGGNSGLKHYRIILGDMMIQSFGTAIPAGGNGGTDSVTISYAWPFKTNCAAAEMMAIGGVQNTGVPSYAMANCISYQNMQVANRQVNVANSAKSVAGTMAFLCFGPAPDNLARPKSKVPGIDGFAMQDKTYVDGQPNKVKPAADRMAAGFFPSRKMNGGAVEHGDFVTANEINWLFNDAYKLKANTKIATGTIAADAAKKIAGGHWITIGDLLIEWFQVSGTTAADWPSNVRQQLFAMPFRPGSSPCVWLRDTSAAETGYVMAGTIGEAFLTNEWARFTGIQINTGNQAWPGNFCVLAIGRKP
ncbi:structural protein [Pantoea phage vB_PagM_LIET2]|uniref:Structural protein n=1 Tax=Pantoea phage vB_PagM_LIET2 TaxID=2508071 RepID=A0A411AW91_9CAUD|nr:structural protein [Pantoea phage vB_PagM_LIET2]QAX92349.1 structural protein [Pantoea phage vB_PagM_LIET2]